MFYNKNIAPNCSQRLSKNACRSKKQRSRGGACGGKARLKWDKPPSKGLKGPLSEAAF